MVVRARNRRWQELEKSRTPLDKLVRHFEAYNRSEGKSARTVEWYTRVLRFYQRYLEEQGHSTELGALTLDVVREFVLYLQTRRKWDGHPYIPSPGGNLAAISVNNYIRGLRAFFSWLHREGYTEEHILARLKPPKIPQKLVEVLTDADVGSILACLDPNMSSGCRDFTMVIGSGICARGYHTDDFKNIITIIGEAVFFVRWNKNCSPLAEVHFRLLGLDNPLSRQYEYFMFPPM